MLIQELLKLNEVEMGDVYIGADVKLLRGSKEGHVGVVTDIHEPFEDDPDGQIDVEVDGTMVYVGLSDIEIV
jgi:hypothetical protein